MQNNVRKSVIGKANIKDIEKLYTWLSSDAGRNYINANWSEQRAKEKFQIENPIGFYMLQTEIPFFRDCEDLYRSDFFDSRWKDFTKMISYMDSIEQTFDLIYQNKEHKFSVISIGKYHYLFPDEFLNIELFKSYDNMTLSQMRLNGRTEGNVIGIVPAEFEDVSVEDIKAKVEEKKRKLENAADEIASLKKEKQDKLEAMKRELEARYKDKFSLLEQKMDELNVMKEELDKQIYMLETEIYGIRCYNGEVVDFTKITTGKSAPKDTPVVIYQKIRYLDEEMGKYISLYQFDGDDSQYFEDVLKYREDLRDIFAPQDKSVSLVRISRTNKGFTRSTKFANMLEKYEKIHGSMLGIILRDGENVWIGWTDEDKISISDENVFYAPKEIKVEIEDEEHVLKSNTKLEEKISRYFILTLLQGVLDAGNMLHIPEKTSILKPSHYVILSMADGWLEDNRFGTFGDIVKRTSKNVVKGDMVLTTQKVTRDDIYERDYKGGSRRYEPFNNDRGRGDKNRTHDVSISDCTVYPINLVDRTDNYRVFSLHYPMLPTEHKTPDKRSKNSWFIDYTYEELQGPPSIHKSNLKVKNNKIFDHITTKGMTPDEIVKDLAYKNYYFHFGSIERDTRGFGSDDKSVNCYRVEFYHAEYLETEYDNFISEEKSDGGYDYYGNVRKKARANMQVYDGEYLNLTFLNSVWVRYAIMNRKMGGWKIGGCSVDYATSIKYLNTALAHLDKREAEEKALLLKYIDALTDEWQVALSEWKMKNNFHILTDTRAKKFAKEISTGKATLS